MDFYEIISGDFRYTQKQNKAKQNKIKIKIQQNHIRIVL
jgi:hypothetical protein